MVKSGHASANRKLLAVQEVPRRLVRAKQHRDITNAEERSWAWVADQLGKSTTAMSDIKTGKRPITLEESVLFAQFFGVRPEWLAFDSGPMTEMTAEEMQQRTTVNKPIVTKSPSDIVKKHGA